MGNSLGRSGVSCRRYCGKQFGKVWSIVQKVLWVTVWEGLEYRADGIVGNSLGRSGVSCRRYCG